MGRHEAALVIIIGLCGGCTSDVDGDNERTEQVATALSSGSDPELPANYVIDFGVVTVRDQGDPIAQLWIDLYYNTWANYNVYSYATNTTTTTTTVVTNNDRPPSCDRPVSTNETDLYRAVVDDCASKFPDQDRTPSDAGVYRPTDQQAAITRDHEAYWSGVEQSSCPNGANRVGQLGNAFSAKARYISHDDTLVCIAQCVVNTLVGYSQADLGRQAIYALGSGYAACGGYSSLMMNVLRAGGIDAQVTGSGADTWNGTTVAHAWVQFDRNGQRYYVEPQNRASVSGLGCGIMH